MNIPRMQTLATYLRNHVDPTKFDMRTYWTDDNCGCTLGHAAHMPEFQLLGFDWNKIMSSICISVLCRINEDKTVEFIQWNNPIVDFQEFMGLTKEQTNNITDAALIRTPAQIADIIDYLITQEVLALEPRIAHNTPVSV